MSTMSPATDEAVASPPAPGPIKVSSPTASPSIDTALSTPIVWASGALFDTMVGWTRCSIPCSVRSATPSSLMRNPSSSAAARSASVIELDALDRHRLGVDPGAEGQRGENGELMGGVGAADVESGVRLRIAQPLRVGETDFERQPFGLHPGQDVVASAVKDAGNPPDGVAGEALAQGLHDRDAAADRRFEKERGVVRLRQRSEPEAVRGEHRLVGGNDRQAARQGGLDRIRTPRRRRRRSVRRRRRSRRMRPTPSGCRKRARPRDRVLLPACAGRYRPRRRTGDPPATPARPPASRGAEQGCPRPPPGRRFPGAAA